MTTTNITGRLAIAVANMLGLTLSKYADSTDGARDILTVEEAREIATQDPSLVYVSADEVAENVDGGATDSLREKSLLAGDHVQAAVCVAALGDDFSDYDLTATQRARVTAMGRIAARVACARVIAEARGRR